MSEYPTSKLSRYSMVCTLPSSFFLVHAGSIVLNKVTGAISSLKNLKKDVVEMRKKLTKEGTLKFEPLG